jgi:hypothetical protein
LHDRARAILRHTPGCPLPAGGGVRTARPSPLRCRRDPLCPACAGKRSGKRIDPCRKIFCPSTLQIGPGGRRLPSEGQGGVSEGSGNECPQGQVSTLLTKTHSFPVPRNRGRRRVARATPLPPQEGAASRQLCYTGRGSESSTVGRSGHERPSASGDVHPGRLASAE